MGLVFSGHRFIRCGLSGGPVPLIVPPPLPCDRCHVGDARDGHAVLERTGEAGKVLCSCDVDCLIAERRKTV